MSCYAQLTACLHYVTAEQASHSGSAQGYFSVARSVCDSRASCIILGHNPVTIEELWKRLNCEFWSVVILSN